MFDFGSMTPYHFDFTREWIEARRQAALARGMAKIMIRDWVYNDETPSATPVAEEVILPESRTLIFRNEFYKPTPMLTPLPPGQPQNEKVIRAQAEFDSFNFHEMVKFQVYSKFACYDFIDQETDVHHSATLLKITASAKIIRGLRSIQRMWRTRKVRPFRIAMLMATNTKFAGPKNLEWSLSDLDPGMIARIAAKCFPHRAPRSLSQ